MSIPYFDINEIPEEIRNNSLVKDYVIRAQNNVILAHYKRQEATGSWYKLTDRALKEENKNDLVHHPKMADLEENRNNLSLRDKRIAEAERLLESFKRKAQEDI